MILLKDRITAISLEWQAKCLDTKDLTGGIKNIGHQVNLESSTPLVKSLEMGEIFKDKAKEEGVSVIDLILAVL